MGRAHEELRTGERAAVARALNDLEDQRAPAQARTKSLLEDLASLRASDRGYRVGVTGPPGVGKSTLVGAMARVARGKTPRRTVGVLAIDPSSAASGGALLGDRIRIAADLPDDGFFVRSLATRGELGGLSRSAPDAVQLLAAAFDLVIVETVGVGQSEVGVRDLVDTLVLVLQPGAGDALQHLKAGVMETPDVIVVNKADFGVAAEKARAELRSAMTALGAAGIAPAHVLSTSAIDGTGVDELMALLSDLRDEAVAAGTLDRRRIQGAIARGGREAARRYGDLGLAKLGGEAAVRAILERDVRAGQSVEAILDRLNPFSRERP